MEGFDVFSGRLEYEPMWLETAPTLNEALEHMRQRAGTKPGPYFVYCCQTHKVLESIDTTWHSPNSKATHAT